MCAPSSSERHGGFTLLELTVVMTLLVLLGLIAVPLFSGATQSARLRAATQQLVATLRYARAKALALGRPVLVQLDRTTHRVRVLVPAAVVDAQQRAALDTPLALGPSEPPAVELDDEEWRALAGERLEVLDPTAFVPDPAPMGNERPLPEGVTIASVTDLTTGDELNLVAFYPDGSASGARIVLQGARDAVALEVAPLTGTVQVVPLSSPSPTGR